jgi:7-cyano-7-deazaguanine synthase in queuosine biosynthesis
LEKRGCWDADELRLTGSNTEDAVYGLAPEEKLCFLNKKASGVVAAKSTVDVTYFGTWFTDGYLLEEGRGCGSCSSCLPDLTSWAGPRSFVGSE